MTSLSHLKGTVKLRMPLVYKVEDGYVCTLKGIPTEWKTNYWAYGTTVVSTRNQGFGENAVNFYASLGMKGHNGTDWFAQEGSTVFAIQDGVIGYINDPNNDDGYGGFIELLFETSGYKFRYIYGHLSSVNVKTGQKVFAGQPIGLSGNTGKYTTGAHLHTGLMMLGATGERLYTDNGYFGYLKEEDLYIKPIIAEYLNDIEKLYWHERITKKGYYGVFGNYNWNQAKAKLYILGQSPTRSNYYDFSTSHKRTNP